MKTLILAIYFSSFAGAAEAKVSIITNAANAAAPERDRITEIFLGKARRWPDGAATKPVDLPEGSAVRNEFYAALLGKSDMEMKKYWATTIFTGAGIPPKSLVSEGEVVQFVKDNPGAIGYVNGVPNAPGVKVLLTLE
jgi:ABC-type phosphate transport system substrate-binding protein